MIFGFPQWYRGKARYQTWQVVKVVLESKGHEVVNRVTDVDAVLFSMCDVTEYRQLMKMRSEAKNVPLIVGGAYAFNFWSAKLYADAVWVGEVFDMADCKTLDEIYASPYCYTGGDELPKASQRIDWSIVPVVQTDKTRCYYWGGVGCKNKCRFCYTSWTHKHEQNAQKNLSKAKTLAKKNKKFLMITSNEYDNDPDSMTFDMLLKDYVRIPVKRGKNIRAGVEFATDESRKKNGKPITKDILFKSIQKSVKESTSLYLFHITGYDTLDDWEQYINDLDLMFKYSGCKGMTALGFNNLQYQNYTPLYAERKSIDPDRYSTKEHIKTWRDRLAMHMKAIWLYPPKPFQHVASRMGVELATNKDQVDYWANIMVNAQKKLTVDKAYKMLFETKVLDTPHLKMNVNTGDIRVIKGED